MRAGRGYHRLGRRDLVLGTSTLFLSCAGRSASSPQPGAAPRPASLGAGTPEPLWGVQSGDVTARGAVLWSRADRPARMVVEWSTAPSFASARRVVGPIATPGSDLVTKLALDGLPSATRIHYRVRYEAERASVWLPGSLTTPEDAASDAGPGASRDVVFVWSGDTNGQGWGIDPARGGMPAFTAARERAPDFFVSCGDAIYADNPIPAEKPIEGAAPWRNVVTEAKSHVAETLDDFRGAFLYPRHSAEVRAFTASVPVFAIWDDHEVRDNWFPGERIDEPARHETRLDALAVLARRAMLEHTPTLLDPAGPLYRSVRWGPHLEIFFLDGRSFRTRNYPPLSEGEAFLGPAQLGWLEDGLARSTATWKVVACDMPIGLVVSSRAPGTGDDAYDGFANTSGAPSGRELELARLFQTLKRLRVQNVVWLTADVHYAAAHHYDPARAAFRDMLPFHEFVAGPMHASSFPRKRFDDTFGPELVYASAGWSSFGSPATGAQYFGVVRIEGRTGIMTVTLVDSAGHDLHKTTLSPAA